MNNILLEANNIGKCYYNYNLSPITKIINTLISYKKYKEVWPLIKINFVLYEGSSIILTGNNANTINMLLNILQGTTPHDSGTVKKNAQIIIASHLFKFINFKINKFDKEHVITNFQTTITDNIPKNKNIIFVFDAVNLDEEIMKYSSIILNLINKIYPKAGTLYAFKKNVPHKFACTDTIDLDNFTYNFHAEPASKINVFLEYESKTNNSPLTNEAPITSYRHTQIIPVKASRAKPVAIGGVGGSGTRLIAEMLKEAGIYIGDDLNKASDNLWFTLLFKQQHLLGRPFAEISPLIEFFFHAMQGSNIWTKNDVEKIQHLSTTDRDYCTSKWLKKRAKSLLNHKTKLHDDLLFGWKEPNTHLFIEYFKFYFENLKYIHVIRNGLDMAYSKNQNQVKFWKNYFLPDIKTITPRESLKFWCLANKRAIETCQKHNIEHIIVNYDNLCTEKHNELRKIASFIGAESDLILKFERIIKKPHSIGRFKKFGVDTFDREDVLYVSNLGFETE